jgi:excisionase family DNA binding protein
MRHRDTPQATATGSDAPIGTPRAGQPKRPRGPLRSTAHSLTEADAAPYLGCSHAYLRQARARGEGPAYVQLGRAIRYRVTDLDAWIAAHRVDPTVRARRA